MANFEVKGTAELIAKLKALGALDNGRILAGSVRAGIRPAIDEAKRRIPVSSRLTTSDHKRGKVGGRQVAPGFAQRNIVAVVTRAPGNQGASALLGTRKEAGYATRFVERGTKKMKAEPWLVPAFEATAQQQLSAMTAYLQKKVNKLAKDGKP